MSALRMTCRPYLAVVIAFALGCPATARAQAAPKDSATSSSTVSGPPNALQGFSQNRDKPIQIDAARLEVRDKDKVATFFGDTKADVKVVQGDVTMRSKVLVVFYEQDEPAKSGAGKSVKAAAPGPGGSSQIKRLEAKGNVIVTQKDQTVTGENGLFDMKSNTVTMTGSVVMTQCENVLRGDRLVVDLTTGVSKVDGGRVQGLLLQSKSGCGGAASPAAPAPGPAKQAPGAPRAPQPLSGSR
jgi:lipopolysaccharide export system protein LptA